MGPHLALRAILWCFSSCSMKLWIPFKLRQGPLGTSRLVSGKSSLLSSCKGEHRFALQALQGNPASSRIAGGISWCFSRCSGKFGFLSSCIVGLRLPFVLPMGYQVSFRVAGVTYKLLSSHCWGIGNHLELRQNIQWSSPVATGFSVFLRSLNRGVGPCLILRHGTPLFSRGVKVGSFLLSGSGDDFCFF